MKKISLLLLILFSILLVSCEAESYVVEKKPEAISLQDLKFRIVPFNQVGSKFNQISQELELNKHLVGLVKIMVCNKEKLLSMVLKSLMV